MDLLSARPRFDLYDVEWPVRTYQPQAPPAKMVAADDGGSNGSGEVLDSVVSNGCLIRGGRVIRSVLSAGVRVQSHAVVENSVLMEGVEVGEYAAIRNAIIDKNARIPAGASIGYDMEEDRKCYAVTPSGLVVIEKGWSIESAEHRPSSREPSLNDPMPPWEAPVFSAPRAQACM